MVSVVFPKSAVWVVAGPTTAASADNVVVAAEAFIDIVVGV